MSVVAIIQARMSSTRLPGKVLLELGGLPSIVQQYKRVRKAKLLDECIVAISDDHSDDVLAKALSDHQIPFKRGSLENVLDRFYEASRLSQAETVVRLTGDCPLIDSVIIDETVSLHLKSKAYYTSNVRPPTFPDGMDVEVMSRHCLEEAKSNARLPSEFEHVTPYVVKHFPQHVLVNTEDLSGIRLTMDNLEDYQVIKAIYDHFNGADFSMADVVALVKKDPRTFQRNIDFTRNSGSSKSLEADREYKIKKDFKVLPKITNFKKSDEYRKKIHSLIPGGGHTYSKGDDQFPLLSPAAIEKGKGPFVWDIDGNKYLDCPMGLTSVSLGHAYDPVLEAVHAEIEKGVNFQRPSVIEMKMAEAFLDLIPGHQMIKFAKNGSTATTAAVKLARAFTGKNYVAIPGDHPFYSYDDWFIGTTACSKGVPSQSLSLTFNSNNLETLEFLFQKYPGEIACVISEPDKSTGIIPDYADKIMEICKKHGALYIMDEMITGFKVDFPGVIKKTKNVPDLATWGKGIANGFSFCALTGKKEVMELGGITNEGTEKVFLISSTHGGETHAIAAALKTIEEFKKHNVIEHNRKITRQLIDGAKEIVAKHSVEDNIDVYDCEWMPTFVFKNANKVADTAFKTLFMQEMIARGVLFTGIFCPTLSHKPEHIKFFLEAFEESVVVYKKALEEGCEKLLVGRAIKPVFRKIL